MISNHNNESGSVRRVAAAALLTAMAQAALFAQSMPGCVDNPASPSIGTDIPETYFGPPPVTVQKELVGPLQLLTAGKLDARAGTIILPLYRGRVRQSNTIVWYVLTDATDEGNAKALGLNFAPKLNYAAVTARAVRNGTLMRDGTLEFEAGLVDFTPERRVVPGPSSRPFPPAAAEPGSVGDRNYSPLARITNAGGYIYNAPIIAAGDDPSRFVDAQGRPNRQFVHDKV